MPDNEVYAQLETAAREVVYEINRMLDLGHVPQLDPHHGGTNGGLEIREQADLSLTSFMDVAAVLARFHELTQAVRGRAVLTYRRLRQRHEFARRRAARGYWTLQICTIVLASSTPLLILVSDYPNIVKAIPATIAALLTAFNALVDWRGLSRGRGRARLQDGPRVQAIQWVSLRLLRH